MIQERNSQPDANDILMRYQRKLWAFCMTFDNVNDFVWACMQIEQTLLL